MKKLLFLLLIATSHYTFAQVSYTNPVTIDGLWMVNGDSNVSYDLIKIGSIYQLQYEGFTLPYIIIPDDEGAREDEQTHTDEFILKVLYYNEPIGELISINQSTKHYTWNGYY